MQNPPTNNRILSFVCLNVLPVSCGAADLHKMHKQNEEAYINPERRSRRAPVAAAVHPADPAPAHQADPAPAPGDRVSGTVASRALHCYYDWQAGAAATWVRFASKKTWRTAVTAALKPPLLYAP